MSDPLADVTVAHEPSGRVVVTVVGEIDMSNVEMLRDRIEGALGGAERAVIDLSGVDYLDTRGVRLLASLADRSGLELAVVAPPGSITRQVLEITALDTVLTIRPTL